MTKVKLSKRLHAIANMMDKGSVLADVGCDHALLDVYLLQNKFINKAYACDIKEGAINQAKKNIALFGVKNIDVRLGDGLNVITEHDRVDTVVISGLGNQKILSILKENAYLLATINTVIIQSNTKPEEVRKGMIKLGYYVKDEILVEENNIIYTIIKFSKGFKKYSKEEILYGPFILNEKGPLFKKIIDNKINGYKRILAMLPKSKIVKKVAIKRQIKNLTKLKNKYA